MYSSRPALLCLFLLFCFTAAVSAATAPEHVDRCEADLDSDKSSECGTDALFCTGYAFLGRDGDGLAERKQGCRPCEVMPAGAQPNTAVHDPLNVCNCAAGQFCRHTGPADDLSNRVIGYCEASTLVGTPCATSDDCRGARESSTDGGAARREVGLCVNGTCGQCDPAQWVAVMGAAQYVCPGYTRLADGARLYHNSMPGVAVSCSAGGRLQMSGTANWELKSADAPAPGSATATDVEKKEEDFVAPLLGLSLALQLLYGPLLCLTFIGVVYAVALARARR